MTPEVATGLPSAPSDRWRTSRFSPPGTAAAALSRGARIGSPGLPSGTGTGGVWMMPVAAILFTPATGIGLVGHGRW